MAAANSVGHVDAGETETRLLFQESLPDTIQLPLSWGGQECRHADTGSTGRLPALTGTNSTIHSSTFSRAHPIRPLCLATVRGGCGEVVLI